MNVTIQSGEVSTLKTHIKQTSSMENMQIQAKDHTRQMNLQEKNRHLHTKMQNYKNSPEKT